LAFGFWLVEFIMAMLGRAREREFKRNGTPTATFSEVKLHTPWLPSMTPRRVRGGGVSGYRRAKGLTLSGEEGTV